MEGAPATPVPGPYPVRVALDRQETYNRWLPLVKWLLALPHYIVLAFLLIAAAVVVVVAFFAVILTRRYPEGLFNFVVGTFRWLFRVNAYVALLTDRYPPFSLQDDPDFPARYDVDYPPEVDRWRPLVQWLLAIPYLFIAHALGMVAGAVTLVAFFAILFTKRYPAGLFAMVRGALRWQAYGFAYVGFRVTRYPPFELDQN